MKKHTNDQRAGSVSGSLPTRLWYGGLRRLWLRRRADRPAAPARRVHRLLLHHGPVEGVVVLVVEGAEQDAEQLAQIHVVGRLVEPQAPAVVEVHGELRRETLRAE